MNSCMSRNTGTCPKRNTIVWPYERVLDGTVGLKQPTTDLKLLQTNLKALEFQSLFETENT